MSNKEINDHFLKLTVELKTPILYQKENGFWIPYCPPLRCVETKDEKDKLSIRNKNAITICKVLNHDL